MNKKVLLFLAEGHEECEALIVVDLCRRAGIDLKTVSITGNREITSSHGVTYKADLLFEEADFDTADMLVLPGGMPGTLNLEAFEPLMAKVDAFAAAGKNISAVCAAPTILGRRGILNGKKACCYLSMEGDLKGAEVSYEPVTVDGNIITGRGLGATIPFGLAIIEKLLGKEQADAIKNKIVYLQV